VTDVYPKSLGHLTELAREFGIPIPSDDSDEPFSPEEEQAAFEMYKRFALRVWRDLLSESEQEQVSRAKTDDEFPRILQTRRVRLRLGEHFLGPSAEEFELFTGFGSGDCGVPFTDGETYLVFAGRDDKTGRWTTSICAETTKIEWAEQSLRALRAWKRGEELKPRIYGSLRDLTTRPKGDREWFRRLGGVTLWLLSSGPVQQTVTDHNGQFVFDGLDHLKYRVQILLPGFTPTSISDGNKEIDLTKSSCAKLSLSVEEDLGRSKR
jgi:hypothetical protein